MTSQTRSGKPKLLVIIGTLAHMGGAERQALYLAEYLATLPGCNVELLAFEDGQALRPHLERLGIRVHVLPYYFRWPRRRRAMALARLAMLLRTRIKPDALLPFVGVHSKTAGQVWPFSGASFCWWNQQDEGRDLTGTPTEKRVLSMMSVINSNSTAGQQFLARTYGLPLSQIVVYNNGTPLPDPAAKTGTWRNSSGVGDRLVVTMIANIIPFKDHSTLLKAWAIVQRHFDSGNRPLLVLAGHERDHVHVAALKNQAFEAGLSADDVSFVGAVSDVEALLADTDLVVHSSLTEGCPNSVCEAMAMGKAVVATDIPGCRQALGDGSAHWLVEPSNPRALAERLIEMLADRELRERQGAVNRQRIAESFRIDQMNGFFRGQIEQGLRISLA